MSKRMQCSLLSRHRFQEFLEMNYQLKQKSFSEMSQTYYSAWIFNYPCPFDPTLSKTLYEQWTLKKYEINWIKTHHSMRREKLFSLTWKIFRENIHLILLVKKKSWFHGIFGMNSVSWIIVNWMTSYLNPASWIFQFFDLTKFCSIFSEKK